MVTRFRKRPTIKCLPQHWRECSGANLVATKEVKSPLQFRLGRPCAAAVRFRVLLQLYEGAEDTGTTFDPPWPDSFRPPTSSNKALSAAGKAWMAGTSPATGIWVVSSALQTTEFAQPDSRGSGATK